jgi:hypothetical protein
MGLIGRLTGWEQMLEANNAVVASHLVENASDDVKLAIIEELIAIQFRVQGHYAGSIERILDDLNSQPRSVQMNFVALACISLGIGPDIPGLQFDPVKNPYLAKNATTEEKIWSSIGWISRRHGTTVNWPGESSRVDFGAWLPGRGTPSSGVSAAVPPKAAETGHVVVHCPACDQAARVPSDKTLRITCPKCGISRYQKTDPESVSRLKAERDDKSPNVTKDGSTVEYP